MNKAIMSYNELVYVAKDRYHYYNMATQQKLLSPSTYKKRFYDPFDAAKMSKRCSKSWNTPAGTLENLWSDTGSLATGFGTSIHQMLENYFRYREAGKAIVAAGKREINPAIPSQPLLRLVLDMFLEKDKAVATDTIVTEALLTNLNTNCVGLADRLLVHNDNSITIEDYKIQTGITEISKYKIPKAPYDTLPGNKLSEVIIQLNFYKKMLEETGYTVRGMRVYSFSDEWRVHEIEPIKVIL